MCLIDYLDNGKSDLKYNLQAKTRARCHVMSRGTRLRIEAHHRARARVSALAVMRRNAVDNTSGLSVRNPNNQTRPFAAVLIRIKDRLCRSRRLMSYFSRTKNRDLRRSFSRIVYASTLNGKSIVPTTILWAGHSAKHAWTSQMPACLPSSIKSNAQTSCSVFTLIKPPTFPLFFR